MMEIENLFQRYKQEAFRLEILPIYRVAEEWENFQKYLNTNVVIQNNALIEYIENARMMISKGRRHIRARVIPTTINNYIIFETKIGYLPQSKCGFEFVYMEESDFKKSDVFSKINTDFWLFDKSHLLLMSYDNDGRFLDAKISKDDDLIQKSIEIRNHFICNGKSFSLFLDKYIINNAL